MYSVFPSLQQSWKIAADARRRGHDRPGPHHGRRGPHRAGAAHDPGRGAAASQPRGASASSASAWSRTSCSPRSSLTSRCSRCCRGTSAPSAPRRFGVEAQLALAGGREVRVRRPVRERAAGGAGGRPRGRAPRLPHRQRLPEGRGRAASRQGRRRREPRGATLERAWVERPGAPAAGHPVPVQGAAAHLARRERDARPCRSPSRRARLPAATPCSWPTPATMDAPRAARDAPGLRAPRPRPAGPRHQRPAAQQPRLRAAHAPGRRGVVGGEYLPALPSSVLSVLGTAEQGTSVVPLRTATVWDAELADRLRGQRLAPARARRRALTARPAAPLSAGAAMSLVAPARRLVLPPLVQAASPSSGGSRARATSSTARPRASRVDSDGHVRLAPRPVCSTIPKRRVWSLARDAKGVLYVGTGNEGRVFGSTARAGSVSSTRPSSGSTRSRSGPTGASTRRRRRTARSTRSTRPARPRASSIPPRSTSGRSPSTPGPALVATGGEGRVYRVRREGKCRDDPRSARRTSSPWPSRRRQRLRGKRALGHRLPHRRAGRSSSSRLPVSRGESDRRRRGRRALRRGHRRKRDRDDARDRRPAAARDHDQPARAPR